MLNSTGFENGGHKKKKKEKKREPIQVTDVIDILQNERQIKIPFGLQNQPLSLQFS